MLDLTKLTQQGYNPDNDYYVEDQIQNKEYNVKVTQYNPKKQFGKQSNAMALFDAAEALKTDDNHSNDGDSFIFEQ